MYFMFTRTMETLHKINSTVLVFACWYVHILPMFSTSSLLMSKERLKGRELWAVLSFPFLLCHRFSISDEITREGTQVRRALIGFLGLRCRVWSKVVPGWNRSLVSGLSLRGRQSALLAKPPHIVPPPEFCAQGVSQTRCVNEGQALWACSLSSCTCSIAVLYEATFQGEKMATPGCYTERRAPLSAQAPTPMTLPC